VSLWKLFQHGGGEVVSTPGDHGITLIPPGVDLIGNDEVYSTEYIKECCTRNKLLDLKPYRFEFYYNHKVVYVSWHVYSIYKFAIFLPEKRKLSPTSIICYSRPTLILLLIIPMSATT
jgi:hypothetical protein